MGWDIWQHAGRRGQDQVVLLILSPPSPARLTHSTGPKQHSCKPAFVSSKEHSIWKETFFISLSSKYLGSFLLMGGRVSEEKEGEA